MLLEKLMKNIAKIILLSLALVKTAHSYGIVLENTTNNRAEMTVENFGTCRNISQALEPKDKTAPIYNDCRVTKVTGKVSIKLANGEMTTKSAKSFISLMGRKASSDEVDTYVLEQDKNGNFAIVRQ